MKRVIKKVISTLLLAVCIAALLFSGLMLYSYWSENNESREFNAQIADEYTVPIVEDDTAEEERIELPIQVDFAGLKAQCDDIVGWLYCEDTVINYPVVQGDDNSYYLYRFIDGSYNSNGTLFMDCGNDPDMGSLNTIIYGHHMRSGSMLASLDNYAKQEYYDAHPVMWFFTEARAYRIDLLASFVTPADSVSYELFKSQDELHDYLRQALEESRFVTNTATDDVTQIMTLSTCAYSYDNARTVVIGSVTPIEY